MVDQSQILKEISGEKKLEQAISLSEMVREMARKNIKEQLGDKTSQARVQQELFLRLYGGQSPLLGKKIKSRRIT